jgi:hypothetical protein
LVSEKGKVSDVNFPNINLNEGYHKSKNINQLKVLENFGQLGDDDIEMLFQCDEENHR